MKTLDVLNLWEAFNKVFEAPVLTNEEKAAIGGEILRQLPDAELFVTSHETLKACKRSIKARVGELVEKEVGREAQAKGPTRRKSQGA